MALRKRGDVIAKKATTIAIVNQKGGTAKTTTCENLGIGLAMEGKKVLLVDVDPQGSLTISMGWQQPDELSTTLSTLMQKAMNDQPIQPGEGILHHAEGVDLIPANIELAGMEVALVNSMNREKMLKQVLDSAKREYDYILLDCTPSLGMFSIPRILSVSISKPWGSKNFPRTEKWRFFWFSPVCISNAAIIYGQSVTPLEKRLKARICELCGTTESERYEIHHINKLKNLKGKEPWEIAMLAKRRKTLVVCEHCHHLIHNQ